MSESPHKPNGLEGKADGDRVSFGGFSLSKGKQVAPNAKVSSKSAGSKKARKGILMQDDEASDDEPREQLVFDLGSDDEDQQPVKVQPLIIPSQVNKDWRLESLQRRGVSGQALAGALRAAGGIGALGGGATGQVAQNGPETLTAAVQSGLVVRKPSAAESTQNGGEDVQTSLQDVPIESDVTYSRNGLLTASMLSSELPTEQTEAGAEAEIEQEALRALMNDQEVDTSRRVDIIHIDNDGDWRTRAKVSEDEAYRQDVQTRPSESTLDDYANVPVHEFGAALLRGMGWKDGEVVGKNKNYQFAKPKDTNKRPAFLGIGATPRPVDENEDALFGLKGKKPHKQAPLYTPMVRVSKSGSVTPASRVSSSAPSSPRDNTHSPRRDEKGSSRSSREASSSSRRRSRSRERESTRDRDRDSYRHRRKYYSDQDKDDRRSSNRYPDKSSDKHRHHREKDSARYRSREDAYPSNGRGKDSCR